MGKLDLGDGSTLYIGQNGRRELAKGNDPLVDAQTLALEDLIGVVRDPKGGFAFVAPDGDVYTAKEPLGAIDRAKLNVKGGSLAIGHPFAATGTRIVATLAKILDEAKAKRGLISVCTAGGMGVTAILER